MFFFACGARPAGAKPPPLFCFLNKKPITTFQQQKCADNSNLRLREQTQLKSWIWTRRSQIIIISTFLLLKSSHSINVKNLPTQFFSKSSSFLIWLPIPRHWQGFPPPFGCHFRGIGWVFLQPLAAISAALAGSFPPTFGCHFRGFGWQLSSHSWLPFPRPWQAPFLALVAQDWAFYGATDNAAPTTKTPQIKNIYNFNLIPFNPHKKTFERTSNKNQTLKFTAKMVPYLV